MTAPSRSALVVALTAAALWAGAWVASCIPAGPM
jgi:hypothetical protein